jgi:hypothetical protein
VGELGLNPVVKFLKKNCAINLARPVVLSMASNVPLLTDGSHSTLLFEGTY